MNAEREEKNNLHVNLMGSKEEMNRIMEKLKTAEAKAKKYTEALADCKRKQKMIVDKNNQIQLLTTQVEQFKQKAQKVDKITSQNSDLVTRKCALESSLQARDKKTQEMTDKIRQLEGIIAQMEQ